MSAQAIETYTEEEMLDVLSEVVPHLRHAPGCPVTRDLRRTDGCLCSLDATLATVPLVSVVRCNGCGCHAIEGGGDDDWALRERDKMLFCGDCAEALMGADRG